VKVPLITVSFVPQTESPHQTVFVKPDSSKYLDRQNVSHVTLNALLVPLMESASTVILAEFSPHQNVLVLQEHSKIRNNNANHVVINA
jgi:hypothetical protein